MIKEKRIPDVSQHQGKIKWEELKGKIPGAIIRIGYGDDLKSQDDLYAVYNMRECTRLGIPFAVYIYSYASTERQVRSEIAHTKRVCTGFEPLSYWLDLEERYNTGIWKKAAQLWGEAFPDGGVYSWQWAFEKHIKDVTCTRWICAYGTNDGTRQDAYKPTIACAMWQFTSRGRLPGINGNVDLSECYIDFAGAKPVEIVNTRREVLKKEVAALIMLHLATHNAHGYTQDMDKRQGTGEEKIDIYGVQYTIKGGDRDCSSAVISAYEAAGISCGGATYTGNMSKCMTGTGNFVRRSMKFIAQMGDSYLVHDEKRGRCHTAMCMSAEPDVLAEFSINEKGTATGGKVGDQKQSGEYDATYKRGESHLAEYYDYPGGGWDCILQCVNDEAAFYVEADGSITYPNGSKEVKVTSLGKQEEDSAVLAAKLILGAMGTQEKQKEALGSRYEDINRLAKDALSKDMDALVAAVAAVVGKK